MTPSSAVCHSICHSIRSCSATELAIRIASPFAAQLSLLVLSQGFSAPYSDRPAGVVRTAVSPSCSLIRWQADPDRTGPFFINAIGKYAQGLSFMFSRT
jgi:hypothetical protein